MSSNYPDDRQDIDKFDVPMVHIYLEIAGVRVYQKSYPSIDSIKQCLPEIQDLITSYEEIL